jgi:hypothetical protein
MYLRTIRPFLDKYKKLTKIYCKLLKAKFCRILLAQKIQAFQHQNKNLQNIKIIKRKISNFLIYLI